ncbi:MAG: hypothetical protein KC457_31640, partial [Myxococcales bacterium]|nr:hypothetical protein [Myxococcales bacterium]
KIDEPDGDGGTDTTADTNADTAGTQHPQCAEPAPDPLPDLPDINLNALGDPLFAQWQDINCDALDVAVCSSHGDCASGRCLFGTVGGQGVCSYADIDVWCDGDGEGLNFLDFECFVCSPIEVHAAACCAGLPGFDCRTWPYPNDGPANSVCARHSDCEPGLICGSHIGSGYGICQCPGIDDVNVPDSCWN